MRIIVQLFELSFIFISIRLFFTLISTCSQMPRLRKKLFLVVSLFFIKTLLILNNYFLLNTLLFFLLSISIYNLYLEYQYLWPAVCYSLLVSVLVVLVDFWAKDSVYDGHQLTRQIMVILLQFLIFLLFRLFFYIIEKYEIKRILRGLFFLSSLVFIFVLFLLKINNLLIILMTSLLFILNHVLWEITDFFYRQIKKYKREVHFYQYIYKKQTLKKNMYNNIIREVHNLNDNLLKIDQLIEEEKTLDARKKIESILTTVNYDLVGLNPHEDLVKNILDYYESIYRSNNLSLKYNYYDFSIKILEEQKLKELVDLLLLVPLYNLVKIKGREVYLNFSYTEQYRIVTLSLYSEVSIEEFKELSNLSFLYRKDLNVEERKTLKIIKIRTRI